MPTYLSPGVYVEETDSGSRPIEGVGTAVAAFVGLAAEGPFDSPTLVTNWNQFTSTFGEFVPGSYLAHAVYAFFLNGGGSCYVVRIGGGGADAAPAAAPALPAARAELGAYEVRAAEGGEDGNGLTVEVAASPDGNPEAFTLIVRRGEEELERLDGLTARSGRQGAATVATRQSRYIQLVEQPGQTVTRPAEGRVALAGGGAAPVPVAAGSVKLEASQFVGDAADRTGFGGLEAIDAVTMVAVPDLMAAFQQGAIDLEGVKAVQLAMIAHCELMGDRVAILDPPPDLNAQKVHEWRMNGAGYDSKYAALYWPWVKVHDPLSGTQILTPPSGSIAGIWGRNDDARGVHKAPANEVVRGAVDLAINITSKEQELLNPDGINCIRSFSGRGVRVWGARTLSSDPAWRYLNIRRLFNYLEESILVGTQWVVFEPNDDALWSKMRRTVTAFLTNEWRKGALFGLTPDEAFYVKCDRETNPPEGVDAGQVVCQIGVAPVKPAEFVIFRLSQFSGGAGVNE